MPLFPAHRPSLLGRIVPAVLSGLLLSPALRAEEASGHPVQAHGKYAYARPGAYDFIKHQASDQTDFFKDTFRKRNAFGMGAMIVGTGVLMAYDHSLYHDTLRWGDQWNIPHTGQQKTLFKIHVPFS